MNLDKIHNTECPDCRSKVTRRSSHDQHSSGEWRESVTFNCGAELEYCTNFQRVQKKYKCPNGPEIKERIREKEAKLQKLLDFCNTEFGEKQDEPSYYNCYINIKDYDLCEIRDLVEKKLRNMKKELMAKFAQAENAK